MDEGQCTKDTDDVAVRLTEAALQKLALQVTVIDGCEDLYIVDYNCMLTGNSPGGQHLISVVLKECEDDVSSLYQIFLDENSWYYNFICEAAFERILALCNSVGMLHLLYLSLPEDASPGVDDDWHQKVVVAMIERCSGDLKQLNRLLSFFSGVAKFRNLIYTEINWVTGS